MPQIATAMKAFAGATNLFKAALPAGASAAKKGTSAALGIDFGGPSGGLIPGGLDEMKATSEVLGNAKVLQGATKAGQFAGAALPIAALMGLGSGRAAPDPAAPSQANQISGPSGAVSPEEEIAQILASIFRGGV